MLTLTLKNDVIADPLRPCKTRYKNQRQMMRHAIMSNEKTENNPLPQFSLNQY